MILTAARRALMCIALTDVTFAVIVSKGDVVGKSVRVLTVVEDALVDGIAEPPEPPAQEWLNQVLSALSALDVDEINSLLNLIYGLLNNNYDLLNTTHERLNDTYGLLTTAYDLVDDNYELLTTTHNLLEDNYTLLNTTHGLLNDNYNLLNSTHGLIEDMRDTLYTRTGIILNHLHPIETATAPDMVSRRGAITFTSINSGNNVVIGTVTYTLVTTLGSPAANNVQVLIQGTLRNTVKKLAEAIRGIQDVANITYGSGTSPNPAGGWFYSYLSNVTLEPSRVAL